MYFSSVSLTSGPLYLWHQLVAVDETMKHGLRTQARFVDHQRLRLQSICKENITEAADPVFNVGAYCFAKMKTFQEPSHLEVCLLLASAVQMTWY